MLKINYKEENAVSEITRVLKNVINKDTIIVCVGTDRCIGDSFGPIMGSMLQNSSLGLTVYGTVENPIHALTINQAMFEIAELFPDREVFGIDAAVGENVECFSIKPNGIRPGAALGKILPVVGSSSVKFIVAETAREAQVDIRLNTVLCACGVLFSSIARIIREQNENI